MKTLLNYTWHLLSFSAVALGALVPNQSFAFVPSSSFYDRTFPFLGTSGGPNRPFGNLGNQSPTVSPQVSSGEISVIAAAPPPPPPPVRHIRRIRYGTDNRVLMVDYTVDNREFVQVHGDMEEHITVDVHGFWDPNLQNGMTWPTLSGVLSHDGQAALPDHFMRPSNLLPGSGTMTVAKAANGHSVQLNRGGNGQGLVHILNRHDHLDHIPNQADNPSIFNANQADVFGILWAATDAAVTGDHFTARSKLQPVSPTRWSTVVHARFGFGLDRFMVLRLELFHVAGNLWQILTAYPLGQSG